MSPPILPLPADVEDQLGLLAYPLRAEFQIRRDRIGKPLVAVFAGACPLCVDEAIDEEMCTDLKRRSAYLTIPDLTLRCRNPECRAGERHSGRREHGGPVGLLYLEWTKLLSSLAGEQLTPPSPVAPSNHPSGPNPGAYATPEETLAAVQLIASRGSFFKLEQECLFVPVDGGEPLVVGKRLFYGAVAKILNAPRRSARFKDAVEAAIDHAHAHGVAAQLEYVTGRGADGSVLIHLGGGDVRRLEAGKFRQVRNGANDLVFKTEPDFQALRAQELSSGLPSNAASFPALHSAILDDLPPSTGGLTQVELRALLLGSWIAIFLRPWATARPLALLVGPPGCGKTTTQRLFAAAYFGPEGEVGGGLSLDRVAKDLIAGAVYQSFVVRDDVNDLPPGGLDPLCRASTGTKVKVSEFHETLALGSYRTRAFFLLSGVNPSWLTRPDLLSRLWIMELGVVVMASLTERERVERVVAARPAIMAETFAALRVLGEPLPERVQATRFDSFEKALFPIMERAGYASALESALQKMPGIAARAASRSDPMLAYILALAHSARGKWLTAAGLADRLSGELGVQSREKEPHLAAGVVRNPIQLAKLLSAIERQGSTVVQVESRTAHNHMRLWRLTPLVAGGDGGLGGDEQASTLFDEEEERLGGVAESATPPSPPSPPRKLVH